MPEGLGQDSGHHETDRDRKPPVRQRPQAVLRRGRSVLLIAGDWPGVPARLRVTARRWGKLGDGHGRLQACLAEVAADGRGEAAIPVTRWLWLPAEDGSVTVANPADTPETPGPPPDLRGLRAVSAGADAPG